MDMLRYAKLHQKFLPRRKQSAWLWHQDAQFISKPTHAYRITLKISKKLSEGVFFLTRSERHIQEGNKKSNEFWKLIQQFVHSNVLMKSEWADHSIRVVIVDE